MMKRQQPFSRPDRVADEVQKVIASYFYRDHFDNRIRGINITGTRMTKDLRMAYVYYYISGDDAAKAGCAEALNHLRPGIRHEISTQVKLKFAPDVKFFFDESIEHGERIDQLLSELGGK